MGTKTKNSVNKTEIFDTHVHVGNFYDTYYSPAKIASLMRECGVSSYLISSTSICGGTLSQSVAEIKELIDIDGSKVYPCLWLTESILSLNLTDILIKTDIPWKCIKIHTALNPKEWVSRSSQLGDLITLARELHLPILVHTGYEDWCRADKYELDISSNPDVTFILAHGRPFDAAYRMLYSYENVYIDTSFMSTSEIIDICDLSITNRILWGSDTPIPMRYFNINSYKEYYSNILHSLHQHIFAPQYNRLIYQNAKDLFSDVFQNEL